MPVSTQYIVTVTDHMLTWQVVARWCSGEVERREQRSEQSLTNLLAPATVARSAGIWERRGTLSHDMGARLALRSSCIIPMLIPRASENQNFGRYPGRKIAKIRNVLVYGRHDSISLRGTNNKQQLVPYNRPTAAINQNYVQDQE